MEAMAKGLPVAATAVSGIPEQLGGTGHLLPAPVPDATELVRQLTAILQAWSGDAALRRQVGAAGRRRAQQMFREATMIGHTVALIRRHLTVTAPACAEPMFREEQKVVRTRDQITPVMDPKAAMPAKCELQTVS
jgi:hypothetical protein